MTASDDGADRRAQAAQYARLVDGCRPCARFTVWGLDDADSWVPSTFPGYGAATPYDENYAPKPAYYGIAQALGGTTTTPPPGD